MPALNDRELIILKNKKHLHKEIIDILTATIVYKNITYINVRIIYNHILWYNLIQ